MFACWFLFRAILLAGGCKGAGNAPGPGGWTQAQAVGTGAFPGEFPEEVVTGQEPPTWLGARVGGGGGETATPQFPFQL